MHADALVELYMPASHSVQFTATRILNFPASHDVHELAAILTPVANPAAQSKHDPVCAMGAYLPLSQYSHDDSLNAYWPGWHFSQLARSGALSSPDGHTVQFTVPENWA